MAQGRAVLILVVLCAAMVQCLQTTVSQGTQMGAQMGNKVTVSDTTTKDPTTHQLVRKVVRRLSKAGMAQLAQAPQTASASGAALAGDTAEFVKISYQAIAIIVVAGLLFGVALGTMVQRWWPRACANRTSPDPDGMRPDRGQLDFSSVDASCKEYHATTLQGYV